MTTSMIREKNSASGNPVLKYRFGAARKSVVFGFD